VGDQEATLKIAAALEQSSEHPLAVAILNRAKEMALENHFEISVFAAVEGKGVTAKLDNGQAFVGNVKLLADYDISADLNVAMEQLQNEAKTVVLVGFNDQVVGLIAIQDAPKETSASAIKALKEQGLKTIMLTGDNVRVAEAVAKTVGIDQVIADVLPSEKAKYVQSFQQAGKVAFVGDGINDAPALTVADVGIAMGSGTDIAIDSGGIILVKNDLRDVSTALELSKKTFNRIKLNLFWAFVYNVLGIPVAAGVFYAVGLSLSPELAGLAMAFSSLSVVISSLLLSKTHLKSRDQLETIVE